MTVEIVEYIDSLDRDNPKGSDAISEGDDHVRNIKKAILDTFPNIKGPVTVTQEELNSLEGLDEIVSGALPDRPTEKGSMLFNAGSGDNAKWKETTALKVTEDGDVRRVFIPALAGLGNVNLYVNDEGEIVASEQSEDPTFAHGLNEHTDVEFEGEDGPQEDDVMIHDGVAWRAKQFGGGGTMKGIEQPSKCGNFSIDNSFPGRWSYENVANSEANFAVPPGVKFILTQIYVDGNVVIAYPDIKFDGVAVWKNVLGVFSEIYGGSFFTEDVNEPNYVVKDSIRMILSGSGRCVIQGNFAEDA